WLKVTGTAAITGFTAYGDAVGGALGVVGAGPARTQMLFAHIADGGAFKAGNPWATGMVFLNTGSSAANFDVYAMTGDGDLVGSATNMQLAAGKRVVTQLHDLIPAVLGRNGGFIFVRSNNSVPLIGIELFYTSDVTILSNVAAGAVAAGITYTP